MNIPDEDKRIKKLEIDGVKLEQHAIDKESKPTYPGGNSLLNVKKLMLELRMEKLIGSDL